LRRLHGFATFERMKIGQIDMGQALAPLVDLIYPPRCPSCGGALAAQDGLCTACWGKLVFPAEPACAGCQRPLPADMPAGFCTACCTRPPRHDGIYSGTLYTDSSRRLILSFKHGGKIALAPMLARMIAARLPDLPGEWLVVPVPLHRTRLWRRGFNQAALLAQEIARLRGQRTLPDALLRKRATRPLGGLGRAQRAEMLAGAVAVHQRHLKAIRGAQVILADDVVTSGATTDACVGALKEAGAARVLVACFARVVDGAN
jgi:ComF family protein